MLICLVVPLIFLGLKFFERHLLIWLFGDIEGKVLTTNSVIKSKKKILTGAFMCTKLGELVDHIFIHCQVVRGDKCTLGILHDNGCASWGSFSVGGGLEMCSFCLMWLILGKMD